MPGPPPPPVRYRKLILPPQGKVGHPRYWWRAAVALVATAGMVVGGVRLIYPPSPPPPPPQPCSAASPPHGDAWPADGECVGITDGSYDFELPDFRPVLDAIRREDEAAGTKVCAGVGHRPPVAVGVLMTLSSRWRAVALSMSSKASRRPRRPPTGRWIAQRRSS